MSYVVLALKWRPQTFEEVAGQEPIAQTLVNASRRAALRTRTSSPARGGSVRPRPRESSPRHSTA